MKNNKKNILILAISFPRWATDHLSTMFLFELSRRHANKYNIFFLVPHTKGAKMKEIWQGVTIYRYRYFWPPSLEKLSHRSEGMNIILKKNKFLYLILPFLFIFQFLNICFLVKKEKIDIIHAHWFFPSGINAILAAKFLKKFSIVSGHGSDLNLQGFIWKQLKIFILKYADLVTVTSQIFIKDLTKLYPPAREKIYSISMGIDTDLFYFKIPNRVNDKINLLFVGRLTLAKGISYLVKAMPKILEHFSESHLNIVGYGNQEIGFKKIVRDLSLDKKITFRGGVNNKELPNYYHNSLVFILPSLKEGVPVAIMEAMSCGCAVVATAVGGVPDLIEDGVTGVLIKPESEEEIYQSVIKLLSNNDLREKIIKNARKKMELNYDWQIIANKFEELYNKF